MVAVDSRSRPSSMPLYWKCMWSTRSRPGLKSTSTDNSKGQDDGRPVPEEDLNPR